MFTTINQILSLESIAFQNTRFRDSLVAIFDHYRGGDPEKTSQDLEIDLAKCIKEYTNQNIDVRVSHDELMVSVPKLDKNSPLLEGYGWKEANLSKTTIADIRRTEEKELRTIIDPNTGFVNGWLAELDPVHMNVNVDDVYGTKDGFFKKGTEKKFTSRELAAGILHEVGHLWTFFVQLVRFRTTNQILSSMIRQLEGSEDFGKRELIIREASTALDIKAVDALELSRKANTTIFTIIISSLARVNTSQSGEPGYDINSFEALADQYATRHGAGRDLVTYLDKTADGSMAKRGTLAYFFVEFTKLTIMGGMVFMATTGASGIYYIATLLASMLLFDSYSELYDKTGYRFKRIRAQLVQQLKDSKLTKEISTSLREDIDFIDEVNKKYKDHVQFMGMFYDYLIPSGVNKRKQIEFQQQLEELSTNDLFIYANKLKHS